MSALPSRSAVAAPSAVLNRLALDTTTAGPSRTVPGEASRLNPISYPVTRPNLS
jgi:hypothetical protein